jgi:hypothetical protein
MLILLLMILQLTFNFVSISANVVHGWNVVFLHLQRIGIAELRDVLLAVIF